MPIIAQVRDKAAFRGERFNGVPLNQTSQSKTMLVCLEPGQAIVHQSRFDTPRSVTVRRNFQGLQKERNVFQCH